MGWQRQGLIFRTPADASWNLSHAQVPTVLRLDGDRLRIFYATRDAGNRSRTSFIDVSADQPERIIYRHDRPILPLGDAGFFDDSGIMPSDVIDVDGATFLYYIGWNIGVGARYRLALGLAVSEDGGKTFRKYSTGPIVDRSVADPISVSCNSVTREFGRWRMWYMSYTDWRELDGMMEPFYVVRHAESSDGIHWTPSNETCISLCDGEGGIARPSVLRSDHGYDMWFASRGLTGYRTPGHAAYRILRARSSDGLDWERQGDSELEPAGDAWESDMVAYPELYAHQGRRYMLYNGNGFGRSGFGYAVWAPGEKSHPRIE